MRLSLKIKQVFSLKHWQSGTRKLVSEARKQRFLEKVRKQPKRQTENIPFKIQHQPSGFIFKHQKQEIKCDLKDSQLLALATEGYFLIYAQSREISFNPLIWQQIHSRRGFLTPCFGLLFFFVMSLFFSNALQTIIPSLLVTVLALGIDYIKLNCFNRLLGRIFLSFYDWRNKK